MPTGKTDKTTPVSIRLSADERSRLEAEAGRRSLSEYIRARLFGEDRRVRDIPAPKIEARQLAHVLAVLGQSELAPSLRELLRAVQIGDLPAPDKIEASLTSACAATLEIRRHLMVALGLVEGAQDDP